MPVDPPPSQLEGRFTRTLNRWLVKLKVDEVPHIKRVIVTVVGVTVLIFGAVLIVTPGPAVLVMPVGLAILGTEYAWARRWLRKARKIASTALSQTQKIIGVATSSTSKVPPGEVPAAVPVTMDKPPVDDEPREEMAGSSNTRREDQPLPR